jgi:hypothetical protein
VKAALESPGFQVAGMRIRSSGDCQAFSLTVRLPVGEPAWEIGDDLFERQIAAVCGTDSTPAGQVAARGSATGAGLTLRLRDVDLADAFQALHQLTGRCFVLDQDVTGRIRVDLEGTTLDEALAAMRSVGVAVGPGPMSRVSRAGVAPAAAASARPYSGAPVSLHFKNAVLIDVLRLFADIAVRKVRTTRVVNGRVSMFCRETPWDQALEAIAASAGLTAVVEKDAVLVGPVAAFGDARRSGLVDVTDARTTDDAPRSGSVGDAAPAGLDIADLRLVGVAEVDGAWRAYAYGPWRKLHALDAGQELFDGRVRAVGPSGVSFETTGGRRVEVAVPR